MSEKEDLGLESKTAGELINYYLSIREAKADLANRVKKVNEIEAEVQQALINVLDAQGVDSTKIKGVGSATKNLKTNYGCDDWNEFYAWLFNQAKELEAKGESPVQVFAFLQKRMSSTEIQDFKERFDAMPPAVKMHQEYTISVRKDS